jgi:hypothetical protein
MQGPAFHGIGTYAFKRGSERMALNHKEILHGKPEGFPYTHGVMGLVR